jgi:hypothetical protein
MLTIQDEASREELLEVDQDLAQESLIFSLELHEQFSVPDSDLAMPVLALAGGEGGRARRVPDWSLPDWLRAVEGREELVDGAPCVAELFAVVG